MKHLLFIMLLVSCGPDKICWWNTVPSAEFTTTEDCTTTRISGQIHDEVFSYVAEFSSDALMRNVPCYHIVKIGFLPEPLERDDTVVGYCDLYREVRFIRPYWDMLTPIGRRTLVYHELGHCSLHLEHTSNAAIDIMNPYLMHDNLAEKYWPALVDKLFAPGRKKL